MKFLITLCLATLFAVPSFANSLAEQADYFQNLFNYPSSNTKISKSSYNVGETRPKAILKGVFYIGGSDRYRALLSSNFKSKLCNDGFSKVYSVYLKVSEGVSCSENEYRYQWIGEANTTGGGDRVKELMTYLYNEVINGDAGAVFLHCHHGVHASNVIAQMALMQFCGVSSGQARKNWHAIDLYNSLGASGTKKQMRKINAFQPYPGMELTAEQRATICY